MEFLLRRQLGKSDVPGGFEGREGIEELWEAGMRVLLVSPLDPEVPSQLRFLMGGENTYTRILLQYPPQGVTYIHHYDALRNGEIRYGKIYNLLRFLIKFRILPLSPGSQDLQLSGNFNLVHCHGYTLRLSGKSRRPPVVLGNSVPNHWALFAYFKQSALRISSQYALRQLVHQALGVFDQDLSLGDFSKLIVMSEFAKREHIALGASASRIAVIYPGLPDRGVIREGKPGVTRILFAGVWFERKGGLVLWEAYRRVKERFGGKVSLTILGPLPHKLKVKSSSFAKAMADREKLKVMGIEQHDFVPYKRLVEEFYSSADVLVHVPPQAEGYGLVVSEAMSFGICPIVSSIGALPEMVLHRKTGLVVKPGSIVSLAEALAFLVQRPSLRKRLGQAARQRFLRCFSLPVMHQKLLAVYEEALAKR